MAGYLFIIEVCHSKSSAILQTNQQMLIFLSCVYFVHITENADGSKLNFF